MTPPEEFAFDHDHGIDMSYRRDLSYLFDLEDGTYLRVWISGHLHAARVNKRGCVLGESRMFVVNNDTCDHAEARSKAFLDSRDSHRIAWGLFWDLAVTASFDGGGDSTGKFEPWLRETFGSHVDEWFKKLEKRRTASVGSVLES